MIYGIGLDVVELNRIEKAMLKTEKFISRILTENERQLFDNLVTMQRKIEFVAGRFAAKEACSKAFGTGIGELSFLDMEVLPDERNKPVMTCSKFEGNIFVSITHIESIAISQVVLEVM